MLLDVQNFYQEYICFRLGRGINAPKSGKNMVSPQALYFALKAKVRDGIKLDIIWWA